MNCLIGVSGFAGAGKTTAVRYLARRFKGKKLYLGETVLNEVRKRGLSESRENERRVRLNLREVHGPAALALPFVAQAAKYIAEGRWVFVDAIFLQAELDVFRAEVPNSSVHVLAIEATFDNRLGQLSRRPERPFTRGELEERDRTELETLDIKNVMSRATFKIENDGSLAEFYGDLANRVQPTVRSGTRTVVSNFEG